MTRISRREFEAAPLRIARQSPTPVLPFTSVALSTSLSDFFAAQMNASSRVRGGLLFGFSENEVLSVLLASTAGPSCWYPPDTRSVLEIDLRFAFGWSESLLAVFGGRLEWVGNWVIHADSQLKSNKRDLRHFRSGFTSGLIHDRSILLIAGYSDGALQTRTYTQVFEEGPTLIETGQTETAAQGQLWRPKS